MGNGNSLMTAQEPASTVQYDIPSVHVAANNAGWIAIHDLQAAVYGEERVVDLFPPHHLAKSTAEGHAHQIGQLTSAKIAHLADALAHRL